MKATFARIAADGGIAGAEREIGTVEEVFRLQRMDEVREIEARSLR